MIAALRSRVDGWFLSRRPPSDTLALTQRNVYILPTRAGWMLAATLLLLLVASINYQLNLGYLLTFLLAGCVGVGMHVGHATLRGLDMHLLTPEAQYAGSAAVFRVMLHNSRRAPRYGIGMAVRGSGQWAWTDVPAQGSNTVEIAFQPAQRGLHPVPPLVAETRFPLGTFRVWTVWRPAAQVMVYPAPELQPPPLPPGQPQEHSARTSQQLPAHMQAGGEFDGVRTWRSGDSLRQVVWKKVARAQAMGSDDLFSRDTQHNHAQDLWLDLAATGLAELEPRLSRLCAWVLMADRLNVRYGLRSGARAIGPARGPAHRRACLELLATC